MLVDGIYHTIGLSISSTIIIPLQYHYHTIGISMSFIRHTQPGPDFLEIQPGVLWPNLTGDEDVGWNRPFLMGFCMTSTIQLLGVPPWRAGNRKPPNLFWRDSSHCFTFLPLGFLEFRGCQFLAVGCLQNWFVWLVRPPVWLTSVTNKRGLVNYSRFCLATDYTWSGMIIYIYYIYIFHWYSQTQ